MLTIGDRWCRRYSGEVAVKTLEIQRYPTRPRFDPVGVPIFYLWPFSFKLLCRMDPSRP